MDTDLGVAPVVHRLPAQEVRVFHIRKSVLQSDRFAHQSFANEYALAPPSHSAAFPNPTNLPVIRVFRLRQTARITSAGRYIEIRRCFHLPCGMRPLLVVFLPELIKRSLLRSQIGGGGPSR